VGFGVRCLQIGSGNPINRGVVLEPHNAFAVRLARRKSADSPAEADSVSGPTGRTDSGESVSDSEPEGKAQKTEDRRQKTEVRSQEPEVRSQKSEDMGFATLKSFRPCSAGTARLRCGECSPRISAIKH
jgi:hypothetical protein